MTLTQTAIVLLLGMLLPAVIHIPLRAVISRVGGFSHDETEAHSVAGAILGACIVLLSIVGGIFQASVTLPLITIVVIAAVLVSLLLRSPRERMVKPMADAESRSAMMDKPIVRYDFMYSI